MMFDEENVVPGVRPATARTSQHEVRGEVTPLTVARDACTDFSRSSRLEWLETDGTGGFAMGTAAGVNTRRYHGLLVAALSPPVDRHVLLSKVHESVSLDGKSYDLGTTQYPGAVHPRGYTLLESFRLDPFPIWTYALDGLVVEKRLFLVQGRRTAILQYRASRPCRLRVRPFLAFRDFHALAHANGALDGRVTESRRSANSARVSIAPYASLPALTLQHDGAFSTDGACWYHRAEYLEEQARGLDFEEDLYCMGAIDFAVTPEHPAWIVASIGEAGDYDWLRVAAEESVERERRRTREGDVFGARLASAANAFRVARADGRPTIVAGYPWFADWGRDTMISVPGLLLSRGLLDEAKDVLTGFLEHADRGVIPNRFPDRGEAPEYNTADGTLWMFHAAHEYVKHGGDRSFVRDVFYPRAKEIILWHERGTHHGIGVDPEDGLLVSGGPGTQLTWMDAKIGDWVVTPRHGKAVEINALWFNALRVMEAFGLELGDTPGAAAYAAAARRVQEAFVRAFWNEGAHCLYDVVLPEGPDARLRPNQIFAVSLPFTMLPIEKQQKVVLAVEKKLLTPYGLRTLAPGEPGYRPTYGGDPRSRDSAYHEGTVWPWLLGAFATAYLNAFGRGRERLAYVASLLDDLEASLGTGLLGNLAEVFDADPPHRPGGAPAQAWSVAEILRVWKTELGGTR